MRVLIPVSPMDEPTDPDGDAASPGSAPELSPASTAPADSPLLRPNVRTLTPSPAAAPHSPAPSLGAANGPAALLPYPSTQQPQPVGDGATRCGAQLQRTVCGCAPEGIQPNPAMDGSWLATCVAQRRLGQGAFGHVDLVLVHLPGRTPFHAARKRMEAKREHLDIFKAEVEGLRAGAGCPHIVQLYDARVTDTHFELLLELMEGGTVEEELATSLEQHGRVLSPGRIREIAACSLQALVHLHRRGVCVRDLKPANLLVRRPGGEVVVADLGLATRSDSGGRLEEQLFAGTVCYLAPEASAQGRCDGKQQQGARHLPPGFQPDHKRVKRPVLTVKVDVFALGASLRQCAGWLSRGEGWEAGIPADLRSFLDHLAQADPATRPTARHALQHSFLLPA